MAGLRGILESSRQRLRTSGAIPPHGQSTSLGDSPVPVLDPTVDPGTDTASRSSGLTPEPNLHASADDGAALMPVCRILLVAVGYTQVALRHRHVKCRLRDAREPLRIHGECKAGSARGAIIDVEEMYGDRQSPVDR
jgi:hypothetical protein